MEYEECFEKVRAIIAEHFNIGIKEVQMDSEFVEDFEADSLDAVELKTIFEENFQIKIPDEVVAEIKTVKNFMNYLSAENVFDFTLPIWLGELDDSPYLKAKWEKYLEEFRIWDNGDKSEPQPRAPFTLLWEIPIFGFGTGRRRKISKSKKKKLAAKQAKKQDKQNSSGQTHRKKLSKAKRKQKFLAEQNKKFRS